MKKILPWLVSGFVVLAISGTAFAGRDAAPEASGFWDPSPAWPSVHDYLEDRNDPFLGFYQVSIELAHFDLEGTW